MLFELKEKAIVTSIEILMSKYVVEYLPRVVEVELGKTDTGKLADAQFSSLGKQQFYSGSVDVSTFFGTLSDRWMSCLGGPLPTEPVKFIRLWVREANGTVTACIVKPVRIKVLPAAAAITAPQVRHHLVLTLTV